MSFFKKKKIFFLYQSQYSVQKCLMIGGYLKIIKFTFMASNFKTFNIVGILVVSCLLAGASALSETTSTSTVIGNNTFISDELGLIWPFSNSSSVSDYPFSSPFGPRLKASSGYAYDFHRGIDIPRPNMTALYAVNSGLVFRSRLSSSGDRYITLKFEHPSNVRSYVGWKYYYAIYRHLNESLVTEGTNVTQGDMIAYSGESASGFDHLHFDLAQGASYEQNNTHPLLYLPYNNTASPEISRPLSQYFDVSSRVLNFTVTVDSDELDLLGVTVNGSINSNSTQFEGTFDFPYMNRNTHPKTALDNPTQTLSNGATVTVYPESHNKYNTECVVHFAFDFSALIGGGVTITDFVADIKAYDVVDGYETVTVTGV